MGEKITAAKAYLHRFEEPPISGKNGSGTVFFSGCNLACVFCQNDKISHNGFGREITPQRLADIFFELQEKGAHNINLVTPTHFSPNIIKALDIAKPRLKIPVILNSSGYEKIATLKMWEGYIDIYLPDIKYFSSNLSEKYSKAPDYFKYASTAVSEMKRQVGDIQLDDDGILQKGLIIRHLVLPGCYKDSLAIIEWVAKNINGKFLVSIMNQYTPNERVKGTELDRTVSTFEYKKVLNLSIKLNLNGFSQMRGSSISSYTPIFDLEGI